MKLSRAIDQFASEVYGDAGAWLRAANTAGGFQGIAPLTLIATEGHPGMRMVLAHLQLMAMRERLKANPPKMLPLLPNSWRRRF